jgi:hypothetical protein
MSIPCANCKKESEQVVKINCDVKDCGWSLLVCPPCGALCPGDPSQPAVIDTLKHRGIHFPYLVLRLNIGSQNVGMPIGEAKDKQACQDLIVKDKNEQEQTYNYLVKKVLSDTFFIVKLRADW